MRKLLIALLLLAVVLLLPLAVTRSEHALLFLANWAVDSFTDLRLVVRSPELRPLRGQASAQEIHLYPRAEDGPPFISILGFAGEFRPLDIYSGNLRGSRLRADQVTIYISDRDQIADPTPVEWLQYLSWLPKTLDITQVHLVNASREVFIFPLQDLTGHRPAQGRFQGSAEAQYEGEPLLLQWELSSARSEQSYTGLVIDAGFTAPDSGSHVQFSGDIRGTREAFTYDFQLDADYKQIDEFLEAVDAKVSLSGSLAVKARMRGNTTSFTLSDASFVLDNMPHYGVEAAGTLDYHRLHGNRIHLVTAGEITAMEPLLEWIALDLRPLGKVQGGARVSGPLEQPVVEQFVLHGESENGLSINIKGRLEAPSIAARENRIEVDISGPELAVLSPWTGRLPHEPGPFRASGVISGNRNDLSLGNFIAEVGSADTVKLRVEGSAKSTGISLQRRLAAISSAQFTLFVSAPDSANLSPYWQAGLPGGFEINGQLQLEGSGDRLYITGGKVQALSSDISVEMSPHGGLIQLEEESLLKDLSAGLAVSLSDTSALSQFTTSPVPVLGALKGSANLIQAQQKFALENILLELDADGPALHTQGHIKDLESMQGVHLQNTFSGIDTRSLLMSASENFYYSSALGTLRGQFTLEDNGGDWSVTNIAVSSTDRDGPLRLDARGQIAQLTGTPAANLTLKYQVRDPDLLTALTSLRMNPVQGELRLQSSAGVTSFNSESDIGNTHLLITGELQHSRKAIEQLTLRLDSPQVYLDDLGLQAGQLQDRQYRPSEQLEELEPGQRLENALQQSPRYRSDIALNLGGISGEHTSIDRFDLHFTGLDHRYTLRRFSLAYGDSSTEIRGIIDLNSSPPSASLAGEITAMPMNTLSRDLGIEFEISGLADVRGGLTSRGRSTEELLATMDGNFALALEDAEIEGAAYDVLATDLLAWFYSGAAMEKSTHLDCTMAQFVLDDGVANSDSLYLETSKMVATGEARLDFAQQTMDVSITPRSKSRSLQVPASIRLKGPFDDPDVKVSPIAAAFDAYAEFLALVPRMARKIFGIKKDRKRKRPCEVAQ